jgi:hypothetical protein
MRRCGPLALAVALVVGFAPAVADARPVVDWSCNGSPSCDGWFRSDVFLDWTVAGGSPTGGCVDVWIRQDTAGNPQGCIASDGTASVNTTVTIKLDRTPPIISAALPDRPPDHSGWYTHPVTFSAQAHDVTSKLAGCDAPSYGGPDAPAARVVVTCRDVASRPFAFSYDATPPSLVGSAARIGDRVVRLRWLAATSARVVRTPGFGGSASTVLYDGPGNALRDKRVRNGRRYRYLLTLTDQAGNWSRIELSAVPGRRLLAPAKRAVVAVPPKLDWTSVRGASIYNVQLFHKGRKILSKWPKRSRWQLEASWRFAGKRRHLRAGKSYTWYVWPGKGRRAALRYGRLIGHRSFQYKPAAP